MHLNSNWDISVHWWSYLSLIKKCKSLIKKHAAGSIVSNYKPFCAECQYFAQDSDYFYLPLPGKIYILKLMMINDQDCLYLVRTYKSKDESNFPAAKYRSKNLFFSTLSNFYKCYQLPCENICYLTKVTFGYICCNFDLTPCFKPVWPIPCF